MFFTMLTMQFSRLRRNTLVRVEIAISLQAMNEESKSFPFPITHNGIGNLKKNPWKAGDVWHDAPFCSRPFISHFLRMLILAIQNG
jgi:hypothetical protein